MVSDERIGVMELYNCINYQLSRAQQAVAQIFKDRLAGFDITPVQYAVLKALWQYDALSPKDIAEIVSVNRPAITGVLDRLESKGLIYRSPDLHDRRAIKVFLTDKAAALEHDINAVVEDSHFYALRDFSDEERELLSQLLRKIAAI